jgi:hypothetical protein
MKAEHGKPAERFVQLIERRYFRWKPESDLEVRLAERWFFSAEEQADFLSLLFEESEDGQDRNDPDAGAPEWVSCGDLLAPGVRLRRGDGREDNGEERRRPKRRPAGFARRGESILSSSGSFTAIEIPGSCCGSGRGKGRGLPVKVGLTG